MKKIFTIAIALLFGLSTLCHAQTTASKDKSKKETVTKKAPKKLSKKDQAAYDKKKAAYNTEMKKGDKAFVDASMKKGDAAFSAKKYLEAQTAYTAASDIFPEKEEPQQGIASVKERIEQLQNPDNAQKEAMQNELDALKKEKAERAEKAKSDSVKMAELQARADSSDKQLYAAKMAMKDASEAVKEARTAVKEADKKVSDNAPADTAAQKTQAKKSAAAPAKSKPAGPKMAKVMQMEVKKIAQPPVAKVLPQPKKGEVVTNPSGSTKVVRESELAKYKASDEYHKWAGDTLYVVRQ